MFVPRTQHAGQVLFVPPELPAVNDVIKAIAIEVLKELAVALAFGGIVACFVATPAGLGFMLTTTIVQVALSILFHSLRAFASYQAMKGETNQALYEKMASICEWFTGANFGLFTGFNSQIFIHESGHALTSLMIYKNPRPLIEIYPFVGGITQFYKTSLSPLGKKIGPSVATCFVVACGPGLTLLISSVLLTIGIAIKEKHPQFGKYLISWAAVDFLNHAFYAYSALGAEQWNLSHDFVHLSIFGLNPMVATVGIIAIPIVISLGMYWWQTRTEPPQENFQTAVIV